MLKGQPFLTRETTFVTSYLLSCTPHSEKGSTLKGGSKFFPFRVDSFSEGKQTVLTELPPLNMYQFPKYTRAGTQLRNAIYEGDLEQFAQAGPEYLLFTCVSLDKRGIWITLILFLHVNESCRYFTESP